MKRILTLSLTILCILYIMPPLLGGRAPALETDAPSGKTPDGASQPASGAVAGASDPAGQAGGTADGKEFITLLRNGAVEKLDLNTYLAGVLFAEMPASFPEEALKAQAVAARTYAMHKKRLHEISPDETHMGAMLCDNSAHCKAYVPLTPEQAETKWGDQAERYTAVLKKAVGDTDGEVLTYKGEPIAAVFHATSSARTENAADVWGGDTPYLVSVDSPGSEDDPRYRGTVTVSIQDFRSVFLAAYPDADLSGSHDTWFKSSNRSEAGGIIDVEVGGVRVPGGAIRQMFGLNSTNFTLTTDADSLTFHTLGRGHGVGLSQYGARRMALDGANYREILTWYYTGTQLSKIGA